MIKHFNKLLLFFMLIGYAQLVYSQTPNIGISLNNANFQGFCAPVEKEIPVTWPISNPSTTEYIFILHDIIEPYTLTDTLSYFHDDKPENIVFSFENSSCGASGFNYVIDIYVKDSTLAEPFAQDFLLMA